MHHRLDIYLSLQKPRKRSWAHFQKEILYGKTVVCMCLLVWIYTFMPPMGLMAYIFFRIRWVYNSANIWVLYCWELCHIVSYCVYMPQQNHKNADPPVVSASCFLKCWESLGISARRHWTCGRHEPAGSLLFGRSHRGRSRAAYIWGAFPSAQRWRK